MTVPDLEAATVNVLKKLGVGRWGAWFVSSSEGGLSVYLKLCLGFAFTFCSLECLLAQG